MHTDHIISVIRVLYQIDHGFSLPPEEKIDDDNIKTVLHISTQPAPTTPRVSRKHSQGQDRLDSSKHISKSYKLIVTQVIKIKD